MENPMNRPVAVELIQLALDEWALDVSEGYIGSSREMAVYHALLTAGFLTEDAKTPAHPELG